MSKIGLHLSGDSLAKLGEAIAAAHAAGNDIPLLVAIGHGGTSYDVKRLGDLSKTTVIYRYQFRGQDGPSDMWTGDPVNCARIQMAGCLPNWTLPANWAHFYQPVNEEDPATVVQAAWYNTFGREMIAIANANNVKLALCAFSTGNPKDYEGQPKFSLEDIWYQMLPMVEDAYRGGHAIALHEYGFTTTLKQSAPYHALRYRRSLTYLKRMLGHVPKVFITETGPGGGGLNPGWLEDLAWYDSEIMKDLAIGGVAFYQLGGTEDIGGGAMTQLIKYWQKTPTIQPTYDPCQPPERQMPGPNPEGFDVALYQGNINWAKAVDGKQFAFIKAVQGATIVDPFFRKNQSGAKNAGIPRAFYQYYKFAESPIAQAQFFLNTVGQDIGELPFIVDVEDVTSAPKMDELQIFIHELEKVRPVVIYTAEWWWNDRRIGPQPWATKYALYCMQYNVPELTRIPPAWKDVGATFWQYTNGGGIDGINAKVCLDRFMGTQEQWTKYVKDNVPPVQPPPPTPEPPPTKTKAFFGLHMASGDPNDGAAWQAAADSKAEGVKLSTNTDVADLQVALAKGYPAKNMCLSLFVDFNGRAKGEVTPEKFVDWQSIHLDAWEAESKKRGVNMRAEINREPNIPDGGLGVQWADAASYGIWYAKVFSLLTARWPTMRFGFPGLSPQPNVNQWLDVLTRQIEASHWVGVHCYYTSLAQVTDPENGAYWRRFTHFNKPLIVTESSNPLVETSENKAVQYITFWKSLTDARVIGVYFFIAQSTHFISEKWAGTKIPALVASR